MTDQHWQRTWEVFEAAAEMPADQREAFVRKELADAALAERVFEMLRRLSGSDNQSTATLVPDISPEWSRLGETIGRFHITGTLGRGGMGEVYEAIDTELERKVAIKFLASGRFGSSGGVERFQREARAASALNHPGIVTIHEILRLDADMAIVMERVEGEPVRKLCGMPLPYKEVVRLGAQIAQALQAAHAAGIVHRDIKPENLMLRPDGLVKILDFGLARQMSHETHNSVEGLPLGTLRYMSPEQIRGERATAASDIFAMGLVLYELATGRHPFTAESALATTHRIAGESPARPSSLQTDFDRDLETLLLGMLDKDPARRPQAGEVVAALTRESAVPVRGTAWKWATVAVAAGALALGLRFYSKPRPAPVAGHSPIAAKVASFTSLPGDEIDPEFSPDGQRVAYAWNGGGDRTGHDIYVRGMGMQDPVRLSTDPADEFSPVWSPDGNRIAYLRGTASGVQVVVVDAGGKNERIITAGSAQSALKKRLAWAPGGNAIILGDDAPGRGDRLTLYRVSLDSGERRRFLVGPDGDEDLSPVLSPDARHVAFVRADGTNRDVYVAGADGTGMRRLVESKQNIHSIAWTPDSEGVYYVRNNDERTIHERRLDGGAGREIRLEGNIRHFSASRGGRHIAYFQLITVGNIWRYSPRTASFSKVLDLTSREGDARYSPSGNQIAFSSDRNGSKSIFRMNRDGSGMRQMTFLNSYSASASWSPDEEWIAFDSAPAGHTEVFAVRVADGTLRKLARGYMPLFSATRPWVYFTSKQSGRNEIWRVDLEGGAPVQVTQNGGLEARESPDGRWLYYSKPAAVGIYRRAVDGGPEQLLAGLQPFERYWDVSAHGIHYVADDRLRVYDIDTGESRELAKLGRPAVRGPRGLGAGPDGSVLYIQLDVFRREIQLADIAP